MGGMGLLVGGRGIVVEPVVNVVTGEGAGVGIHFAGFSQNGFRRKGGGCGGSGGRDGVCGSRDGVGLRIWPQFICRRSVGCVIDRCRDWRGRDCFVERCCYV